MAQPKLTKSQLTQRLIQVRAYMLRKAEVDGILVHQDWVDSPSRFRKDLMREYLTAYQNYPHIAFGRLDLERGFVPGNVSFNPKKVLRDRKAFATCRPFIGIHEKTGRRDEGISRREFAKKHGIRNSNNITHALMGNRKQVEGWIFQFKGAKKK